MERGIYVIVLLSLIGHIAAQAANMRLSYIAISTTFSNPVGIDYHEPTNSIVMSANYPEGSPENFRRIEFDGSQYAFSTAINQKEEIKIATVRGSNPAGFVTGDLFTGNGINGQIMRITNNGARVVNPWCVLPNANAQGLMRGSLYIDDTGVFEYKLIVVTTSGKVWKIAAGDAQCGTATLLADANVHLEGVVTVNNDAKWGGMKGAILAGAENEGRLYAIFPDGNMQWWTPGCKIEDLDMITAGENFFGINFGLGKLLGVSWDQWAPIAGSILATTELPASLNQLYWDTTTNSPKCIPLQTASNSPVTPGQWEHVTFAPAGIREILPSGFSLCIKAVELPSQNVLATNISTIKLSGSDTAVSNYKWNIINPFSTAMTNTPTESNTMLMYFTQDYQNTFALTIVLDNRDSTGGSLSLAITTSNLGGTTPVVLQVQDDQIGTTPNGDSPDTYYWLNGAGNFNWAWGPSRTDGAVLGPLNFVNPTGPFTIQISVTSSTGISTWKFLTSRRSDGSYSFFTVPLTSSLQLKRVSCTCGDNVIDAPIEDCDGGDCCDAECHLKVGGTLCRASQDVCDVDDYCTGSSATCTDSFKSSSVLCNPSLGVCDPAEFCTGSQAACPADVLRPSTYMCRPVLQLCDAPEFCTGSAPDCPPNIPLPNNGTLCDDGSNCTTTSVCTNGSCVGVDRLCSGVCGDGIVAAGEQCDWAAPNSPCCTQYCTFAANGTVCRGSTARCDPPEVCSGTSATCPTDDNTTCPICTDDCSNHGTCYLGNNCTCDFGYSGPTCNVSECHVYGDCDACSTNAGCGWCCYRNQCVRGDSQSSAECPGKYAYHNCTCRDGCVNGICNCGQCICDTGYGSSNCSFRIDCEGTILYPGVPEKVIDICGVCGGNGTTCIGCDGIPNSGKQYDRCGICNGNGLSCYNRCGFDGCSDCLTYGEGCFYCNDGDSSFCFDSSLTWPDCPGAFIFSSDTCPSFWTNLTPVEKGLGGAAIAGIVIGAIVGVICIAVGGGGTMKYLQKQRGLTGVVGTNPMYKDNGLTGQNPLYETPDADYELKKV